MNGYNNREESRLDQFLDETPVQSNPCTIPAQEQFCDDSKEPSLQKKYAIIIALLCGIFAIVIAIFILLIFGGSSIKGNQVPQDQPNYEQPFQNDGGTFGNGNGNDTYGNYGPDYNGNDDGGGEQFGQYQADDGTVIQFRIKSGKAEYSTDGGKTWSVTPPEGMPPLP